MKVLIYQEAQLAAIPVQDQHRQKNREIPFAIN